MSISPYLVVIFVAIPVLVLLLLGVLFYVCCSKRYRLNWYERALLESTRSGEKEHIAPHTARTLGHVYTEQNLGHKLAVSTDIQRVHSTGNLNLSSSQPTLLTGECELPGAPSTEQFWVPDDILMKKRAQSLVPQLLIPHEVQPSQDAAMSTVSASIEDMSADSLGDSMLLMQGPMPGGRVRRRTSMQDALDFTKINAQLYEKEPVPSPDPVTGKFGSINEEDNHGSINFSLSYSPEQGLLTVRLIQARDLVTCDFSGTADPYCRLCLLPNSKPQLQSKVHKKTLSPEFSEEFIFDITSSQLTSLTLEILIYDFDHFSRDECIGQVHLPLSGIDLSEKVTLWKGIAVYNQTEFKDDDLGDVMFSLSYLTSAERLTVAVLKARNLHFPEEMKHTSNPFVKVTLLCPGKKPKKKKTSTIRNCMNPMWNEAIVFSLSRGMLADTIVELTVVNDNLLGANEPIGHVVIGSNTAGEELGHWNDMINSKTAMARWHHLVGFSADARRGSAQ